jgi:hypothetical protein
MNTIAKLTLATLLAASLAACHSAPSESDAKAAVQEQIGDCAYFKVTDFERVNGRQLDDDEYLVQVKYTVELEPGQYAAKLRAFQKAFDQVKGLRIQYGQRMDELNAAHIQQVNATQQTAEQEDAFRNIGNTDPVLVKLTQESRDIAAQLKSDDNNGTTSLVQAVRQECPTAARNSGLMSTFFNSAANLNQLADGAKAEFTQSIWMVKTDNGWQAAHY